MTNQERQSLLIKVQNTEATIQALNMLQVSGESNISMIFALIQYWKEQLQESRTALTAENDRVAKLLEGGDANGGTTTTAGARRESKPAVKSKNAN